MIKYLILLTLLTFNSHAMEKIYIVDTEVNFKGILSKYKCPTGHKSMTPDMWGDADRHGTQMANIIAKGITKGKACLVNIKVFNLRQSGDRVVLNIREALKYLLTQKPGIINMSYNGPEYDAMEKILINKLLKKGFKLSIAAGNDGLDLSKDCDAYPTCYFKVKNKNVKISSNYSKRSNKKGPVTDKDFMKGGTSPSAANTTRKWIRDILNGK